MKISYAVLIVLLCLFNGLFATTEFDELQKKADSNFKNQNYDDAIKQYINMLDFTNDSIKKAVVNNQIGKSYWNMRNYAKAQSYYQTSLKIYQELGDTFDTINLLNNLGTNYNDLGNYGKSLETYLQALALARQAADENSIGFTLNNIGNVYLRGGNYHKAQEYYLKALKIRKELNKTKDIAASYNNIALVYKELNNFSKAIEYQSESLKLCRQIEDKDFCSYSLNNCGNIYLKWQKYDKALEYYQKSFVLRKQSQKQSEIAKSINNIGLVYFEQGKLDLAKHNFEQALSIRKEINDEQGVALSLSQLAFVAFKENKNSKAISLYKKALELSKKIGDNNGVIENKIGLANVYLQANNLKKAKQQIFIALSEAEKIKSLPRQVDCFEAIWQMYESKKMPNQALTYFKKYSELKEELFSAQNAMKIADLQSMYEIEQKEHNIQLLKSQKQTQKLAIQKQKASTMFYMTLAIGLIVILVLLYLMYLNKIKVNKRLTLQNNLIEKQNSELERVNSELVYINKSKNKMFSIISHDLMNPFQIMIGTTELLCMNFQNYKQEELKEFIDDIHISSLQTFNLLENLLTWTRNQTEGISFKPEKLEVKSVVSDTLDLLLNMANKKSIELGDSIKDIFYIWADWNMVSTVIRNLCTNALKFTGKNGRVTVGAVNEGDFVKFTISDTGVGMPPQMVENLFRIELGTGSRRGTNNEVGTGLGLILCKEFVEKNGGEIYVTSKQNEGSCFTFTIPSFKNQQA